MNFRAVISMLLIGVVLYSPYACFAESLAVGEAAVRKTCSCSHCAKKQFPNGPVDHDRDPNGCGCDCLCKGAIVDPATSFDVDGGFSLPAIDGLIIVGCPMISGPPADCHASTAFPPLATAREICAILMSLQL